MPLKKDIVSEFLPLSKANSFRQGRLFPIIPPIVHIKGLLCACVIWKLKKLHEVVGIKWIYFEAHFLLK